LSRISVFAVLFWVVAAILAAVSFDDFAERFGAFSIGIGLALLVAFWGYVIQRRKWGNVKRVANLSVSLWIVSFALFGSGFGTHWDRTDFIIGSSIATLLAFLGYKWQLRFMAKNAARIGRARVVEKSGDARADEIVQQGNEYMKRMEELGGVIRDTEIRRRLMQLQSLGKQIFEQLVKQPAQVRNLGTFMDYYLPTTLKFLESFVDMDDKTAKGEHIMASMDEIRRSMGCIVEAFEHQLDNMYSDKMLDIASDVAVLQGIMRRDGV